MKKMKFACHASCVNIAGIGMTGFEPAASCSQSRRSTKLSHIPAGGMRECRQNHEENALSIAALP